MEGSSEGQPHSTPPTSLYSGSVGDDVESGNTATIDQTNGNHNPSDISLYERPSNGNGPEIGESRIESTTSRPELQETDSDQSNEPSSSLNQEDGPSGSHSRGTYQSLGQAVGREDEDAIISRAQPSNLREQSSTQRRDEQSERLQMEDTRSDRIEREIILPRWQPDAEVTYCPICHTQFSFFVRKHHCRKCGRVVCNSCSPHRITIPYQFIVQPPLPSNSGSSVDFPIRDNLPTDERNGGMRVRLCNPCVPDPNTLPPQQQPRESWRGPPPPTYYLSAGNRPFSFDEDTMNSLERQSSSLPLSQEREITGLRARGMSAASGLIPERRPQVSEPSYYVPPTGNVSSNTTTRIHGQSPLRTGHTAPSSTSAVVPPRRYGDRPQSLQINPTNSITNPQPHYRSLLDPAVEQQRHGTSSGNRPLPPVPRIPEEDECPVCHKELPSRMLPESENLRAAHISKCIDDQIAVHSGRQSRPGAYTSQSQPADTLPQARATTSSSPQAVTPSITISTTPTPSSSSQPIAHPPLVHQPRSTSTVQSATAPASQFPNTPEGRMAAREAQHAAVVFGAINSSSTSPDGSNVRRTGMFPYKATEKDCIDDAECTICLEEFEVGVSMARLECLCRFHYQCIREWFVNHPGRCPVHQHDGYGF